MGLVLRGGAKLLGVGLLLGLTGALGLGRMLAGRLPGVVVFDALLFAAVVSVLGLTSLVACIIPAWRAVRIPPAVALRYE